MEKTQRRGSRKTKSVNTVVLIYAWVDTTLIRVVGVTKMRDRTGLLRELTWEKNDSNEWVKKERLQRQALVLYPQHSHFNTHRAKSESCTPPILIECNKYRPRWLTHSLWMRQGLHHICMQYASQFSHSLTHDHHDRVFSYICKPFCSACPSALIAKRRRTISKKLEWLWREKWQRVRFLTGLGPIAWRHSDSVDDIQSCKKFIRTWTLGEAYCQTATYSMHLTV